MVFHYSETLCSKCNDSVISFRNNERITPSRDSARRDWEQRPHDKRSKREQLARTSESTKLFRFGIELRRPNYAHIGLVDWCGRSIRRKSLRADLEMKRLDTFSGSTLNRKSPLASIRQTLQIFQNQSLLRISLANGPLIVYRKQKKKAD